jgi:hypothetical protein
VAHPLAELVHAEALVPDDSDDGNAEGALEVAKVELAAPGVELVEHGEHQAGRLAQPQDLPHEGERTFQRARIRDHDHAVGRLEVGTRAAQ